MYLHSKSTKSNCNLGNTMMSERTDFSYSI